jgi:hypothetical protein
MSTDLSARLLSKKKEVEEKNKPQKSSRHIDIKK